MCVPLCLNSFETTGRTNVKLGATDHLPDRCHKGFGDVIIIDHFLNLHFMSEKNNFLLE